MESLVVTLETAKKLKAAGFPQNTGIAWSRLHTIDGSYAAVDSGVLSVGDGTVIAAPTAQEIADQLPDDVELFKDPTIYADDGKHRNWQGGPGYVAQPFDRRDMAVHGKTMAESLALLWLKLQEAK
ncbi:hypothetical protein SAMN04487914_108105 [Arthrobacter sp. ok909]|uniref:hypothetical protein n=1 Tax=Arthrobacter sp. ok909 TaxID=1761746 RepID=UPI000884DF1A|nr:hypothetical protein [Arthrobacter sp. ok909]SDP33532.1 hypothetical protein SAMN04487914_108105 [Arthrobacter sp. ok909]